MMCIIMSFLFWYINCENALLKCNTLDLLAVPSTVTVTT